MAHEIGHLLLGRDSHGSAGLMSARWTDAEQRLLVRGELNFTAADSARLRGAMLSRAAGNAEITFSHDNALSGGETR
jgi:hypothetical protein